MAEEMKRSIASSDCEGRAGRSYMGEIEIPSSPEMVQVCGLAGCLDFG